MRLSTDDAPTDEEVPTATDRISLSIPFIGYALLLACGEPTSTGELSEPDVRPWVVGRAAQSLDAEGRFRLPVPVAPDRHPIIGEAEARELALAFVRTFAFPDVVIGQSIGHRLEKEYGGRIDFARLRAGSRVYYAESPYEEPPSDVPIYTHKYLGPWYFVHLLQGERPAVSVEVSAYNTDLWVQPGGRLGMPWESPNGNMFRVAGVPRVYEHTLPLSPERAVHIAGMNTGARVQEVPELILPHRNYFGHYARWRLVLDRAVMLRVETTGEHRASGEIYVGLRWGSGSALGPLENWLALPRASQPLTDTIIFPLPSAGVDGHRRLDSLVVRVRRPVIFDRVAVVRPE